jgi:AMP phosphorylase
MGEECMSLNAKPMKGFKLKKIDIAFDSSIVVLNRSVARSYGISEGSIIGVGCSGRVFGGKVILSDSLVDKYSIGVPGDIYEKLSECESVELYPFEFPPSFSYLRKRLRGEHLPENAYMSIVRDVTHGLYDPGQIAAFLLSQVYKPLSLDELAYLIRAMVETGGIVKFPETVYDEHSIGGVPGNSKVALIAVPIVASMGLLIPKTSSRAITSPAGTADTMEVLARVDFSPEEIHEIALRARGTIVWGGALGLAPADDIFIKVERKLAIDPQTQMVASILAKKLAMSVSRLVIDIPFGKGAKVETEEDAVELGSLFLSQAQRLGITMRVALTYGGEPVGFTIGPALEAREALETLIKGAGAPNLVEKACSLAGLVLSLGGVTNAEQAAYEALKSGKAYAKFREIIEAQEGDPDIKPEDIPVSSIQYTLTAPRDGIVSFVNNTALNMAARLAGAPDDKSAGIRLYAKTGYRVKKGDPLLTVYASTESRLRDAVRTLNELGAFVIEGVLVRILP